MADLVLLSLAVAGLAISTFAVVLLYSAFRLMGRFFSITAIYVLFVLTFVGAVLGTFYAWPYFLAAVAEALALFLVFYQNFRREFLAYSASGIAAGALAPPEAIAYLLSLYFLVYSAFVIVRERRRAPDSRFVFAAFIVLLVSVLFALLSILSIGSYSGAVSYGLLDAGVVLFFLPLFHLRLAHAHAL